MPMGHTADEINTLWKEDKVPTFVTMTAAADLICVSLRTLKKYVSLGMLKSAKAPGAQKRLIARKALAEFLANNRRI